MSGSRWMERLGMGLGFEKSLKGEWRMEEV